MSANDLVGKDVQFVKKWLEAVLADESKILNDFNWLGFAEVSASNAKRLKSLDWADISIRAYEKLLSEHSEDMGKSFYISSMILRTSMIGMFGPSKGHPILDVDTIISWFNKYTKIPFEVAKSKSASRERCTIEDLRQLRNIKNRLAVISELSKIKDVQLDEYLQKWLDIRGDLP
ncbi:hypothetical protein [Mastigocoleus testarum]|nr:hypothetical protein [Mastigocoleus testarum]